MATRKRRSTKTTAAKATEVYKHPEAELLLRPEVGTQAQFRKKKLPKKYRYDDSLSPVMEWDGQNSARIKGEWLLGMIEQASRLEAPHTFGESQNLKDSSGAIVATVTGLQDAVEQLKRIERPFLDWAGKAERLSFDFQPCRFLCTSDFRQKQFSKHSKDIHAIVSFRCSIFLALRSIQSLTRCCAPTSTRTTGLTG